MWNIVDRCTGGRAVQSHIVRAVPSLWQPMVDREAQLLWAIVTGSGLCCSVYVTSIFYAFSISFFEVFVIFGHYQPILILFIITVCELLIPEYPWIFIMSMISMIHPEFRGFVGISFPRSGQHSLVFQYVENQHHLPCQHALPRTNLQPHGCQNQSSTQT